MKRLWPEQKLNEVLSATPLNDEDILHFAEKFRTPGGIIIGHLQRKDVIDYSDGNHLRTKVELF